MAFGPALLAEQPQVLRASQRRVAAIAKKRAMLLPPHRVDGFRHVPHDVESIEHNLGVAVGQALARRADVRLPHIHRDRVQRDLLGIGELGIVARQALRLAIVGHKFHCRALQVTDDGVKPMALAERLLVDADVGHRPRLFPGLAPCDRAAHDAPGFVPTDARNLARAFHRAALQDQIDNQPLHQQRETTPRFRPQHAHLLHAMRRTLHPRNLRVQVRLKLTRVEMPPRACLRMVEARNTSRTPDRAIASARAPATGRRACPRSSARRAPRAKAW